VHLVEGGLVVGVGVDRRHEALLDADGIVQDLCDRREAVGRAGGVRDHEVVLRELVVVHAVHHGEVGPLGRSGDDDALGSCLEMERRLLLRGEDAGAFESNVDAELFVRQLGRVLDRRDLDGLTVDHDRVALHGHFARKATVDRIVSQKMGIGLDRAEVVDGDDLDVLAAALHDGAQDVAPDASEPVDRDLHCHCFSPCPARLWCRLTSSWFRVPLTQDGDRVRDLNAP
jgi:hypothetical protein